MPTPKPKPETGAPANAKLLESHAADAEREVVRLREERNRLMIVISQSDGAGDEAMRTLRNQLSIVRSELSDSYDLWFQLSKQVREYDKAVDTSRREGEKIPRADVEEFFRQYDLSLTLAIESYIISLSQDATRATSAQDFYRIHAENLRSCKASQIEAAIRDKKLPSWAMIE